MQIIHVEVLTLGDQDGQGVDAVVMLQGSRVEADIARYSVSYSSGVIGGEVARVVSATVTVSRCHTRQVVTS